MGLHIVGSFPVSQFGRPWDDIPTLIPVEFVDIYSVVAFANRALPMAQTQADASTKSQTVEAKGIMPEEQSKGNSVSAQPTAKSTTVNATGRP